MLRENYSTYQELNATHYGERSAQNFDVPKIGADVPHFSALPEQISTNRQYDKAINLQINGSIIGKRFKGSAQTPLAKARADILCASFNRANVFVAENMLNKQTGELFTGSGLITNLSSSRINPDYISRQSRRMRKRIADKIKHTKIQTGERFRFITLTLPELQKEKISFEMRMEILDHSLALMKKRKLWKEKVRGAFVGEEITTGDKKTKRSKTFFHCHAHIIALGKFWNAKDGELSELWTDCVKKSCEHFGIAFALPTDKNGKPLRHLNTDIKDVQRYADSENKTFEDAIFELCKYTVKGSDLAIVKQSELEEIDRVLHRRKLVQSFGCFNDQKGKANKNLNSNSAGTSPQDTNLDTQCITDGNSARETLVRVGERLINEGKIEQWRTYLRLEIQRRSERRLEQLKRAQPYATFYTLDGRKTNGLREQMDVLTAEKLKSWTNADGCITDGEAQHDAHREAVRQIGFIDKTEQNSNFPCPLPLKVNLSAVGH